MAVITISRQLESDGDEIAHRLCDKLGYQYFDKNAMVQIGREIGLDASIIQEAANFRPTASRRWSSSRGARGCRPASS